MRTSGAAGAAGAVDLPSLALSDPQRALERARALIQDGADPVVVSYARQAIGIVLRDRGLARAGLDELRLALRAARRSTVDDRVADVRSTLGLTLVSMGRTAAGLRELEFAVTGARGELRARVLMRRAYVHAGLGDHHRAIEDLRRAIAGFRRQGATTWEAMALNNRANAHLLVGSLTHAERDLSSAALLFSDAGHEVDAAIAVENRGVIAYLRGDLPRTLSLYDDAARRCQAVGTSWPELAFDRCQAFLAAGLTGEASSVVDAALRGDAVQPVQRAELFFAGAAAALAGSDIAAALDRGRHARRLFDRQGRGWWADKAELIVLRARHERGDSGRAMAVRAGELGRRLASVRSDDAPVALLLAGRLAAGRWPDLARQNLREAARFRRHPSPLVRAPGWLAEALDRELDRDARGTLRACGRGLDALDEHRTTLGSSELRALATAHGRDLATLALREVVRGGGARRLLAWTERWRATALTEPPVRPPRQAGRAGSLAVLRGQARRRDEAALEATDAATLERDQRAWEQAIRAQRHQLAGTGERQERFDVDRFVAQVDETIFVELVEVDGMLHALIVTKGRVRHSVLGPVEAATQALAAARFALRQVGRGRPTTLAGVGERLQRALLGGLRLGDGAVVVAPPSRLHAVPWTLLPALADRPVTVVPSATMWQRARAVRRPDQERVVLVSGPGMRTGGGEVDVLAGREAATVLRGGEATVEATLAALDGASLAHVAAHGTFRPDSPMFSALELDDGPLTVHDLELLERAPYRLVLSACDSGVMVPVGADELLGLTAALLSMGTAGVVSSVAEVNDEATVDLMLDLHASLAAGAGLAEAMLEARIRARGDLVREATAAAFVALGH